MRTVLSPAILTEMREFTAVPTTAPDTQLATDLAAMQRGEPRSWSQIGQLLSLVDHTGYWRTDAQSFTEWLTTHASRFGYTESTLWRYLGASRFYEQLRTRLAGDHIASPPLERLPDHVSPESLELLSKLTRAAPPDVVRRLAERVTTGTVTRSELRDTWQAFRPVLGGRTARGRGMLPPRFNPADRTQVHSQLEGLIVTHLTSGDTRWTGCATPDLYELFTDVRPDMTARPRVRVAFDAVAVVRAQRHTPLVLHGIEVVGALFERPALFEDRAPYCDALWLAVHKEIGHISSRTVPPYVGILRIHEGELVVERPATRGGTVGTKTGELAKGLLLKCLHR